MEGLISRAQLLIQQQRYADAENVLKSLLSEYPNDSQVLFLLAEVNLQTSQFEKAEKLIDTAIGLSPYSSPLFFTKARIAIRRDEYARAEELLLQALELDPEDADYHALMASVKLDRKEYGQALNFANQALELDAENILGLNIRSTALLKLNRKSESFQTIEGALREDPNNAYTHANYGWGLLEKGNHRKALEHFREALKNNPNYAYAQAGMLEALKANNIFYRGFLKYSFWISNLSKKYQWYVIIGFYIGSNIIKTIARSNDTLRPFLMPVVILLAIFALSTWIMAPLGNLLLRLNKFGKHLLSEQERKSSNFVGASLALSLAGTAAFFATWNSSFLSIVVFGFAMMLPFGSMFSPAKSRFVLSVYAIVLAALGLCGIMMTFATGDLFNTASLAFVLAFIAYQWVANYFIIKESNH